jgi:hypothetical protein
MDGFTGAIIGLNKTDLQELMNKAVYSAEAGGYHANQLDDYVQHWRQLPNLAASCYPPETKIDRDAFKF